MLVELRVKDFGIIEEVDWNLGPGLNVITGETGAGKSLVIDAVEAILSGKLDEDSVRHGAVEAQVEGVFALPAGNSGCALREFLAGKDLQSDEDTLVIEYRLRKGGRSVNRVNGHAVPRGMLQQIGGFLVDIHGQSEHLSLLNQEHHIDYLDACAGTLELRHDFAERARKLAATEEELKGIVEKEKDMARREEFLRFQVEEIKQAKLNDGEMEELQREKDILSATEQLKALSAEACQALDGEEASGTSSALDGLNMAVRAVKRLVELDPSLKAQLGSLEDAVYGVEEAARSIRAYGEGLENDPERIEEIESRLQLIRNLKRKYGQTIAEILAYVEKASAELDGITRSPERRAELEKTRLNMRTEMGQMAGKLSEMRSRAAVELASRVKHELADLGMSRVGFNVAIEHREAAEGVPLADGKCYAFHSSGVDQVGFIVSTNPGEPFRPLARIASTGETSRFTLALKAALARADNVPVLIFDEIDIGVGGRSGEVLGRKLWSLAQSHQVICVTHLPQIAVFADAHFSVHKEVSGERTRSILETLDGEDRTRELAVMLTGSQYGEAALDSIHELLQRVSSWKREQQHPS